MGSAAGAGRTIRPLTAPSYAASARWIILQFIVANIAKFNRMFTYPVNYKCNVQCCS